MSAMRAVASSPAAVIRTAAGVAREATLAPRRKGADGTRQAVEADMFPSRVPSFGPRYYVPFLKAKEGEFNALAEVDALERDHLTPLLEIGPAKVDPKTGAEIETISEAVDGLVARIVKSWGKIDECFVDLPNFRPSGRLDDGTHPVTDIFTQARLAELIAIPVTGLDRDTDYQRAVADAVVAGRKGVAMRLRRDDLIELGGLSDRLKALCSELGVEDTDVDLILDFGEVTASIEKEIRIEAKVALRGLPKVDAWRSLTFARVPFRHNPLHSSKRGTMDHCLAGTGFFGTT
jgi:T4 beta protein